MAKPEKKKSKRIAERPLAAPGLADGWFRWMELMA